MTEEQPQAEATAERGPFNRALFLPYALPYLLYVVVGLVPPESLGPEAAGALRFVLAGAALAWGWRRYVSLLGPRAWPASVGVGVVAGVVGLVLWIALVRPFAPEEGEAWSWTAFLLRMAGATLLVPLFEELLMRGYLLRLVVQRDGARAAGTEHPLDHALDACRVDDVAPGAWTPLALVVSTVAFTLGHGTHEWLAAVVYGLLMAGLWIWRKDLLTCVVAHAVTNLTLALYVYREGAWELW